MKRKPGRPRKISAALKVAHYHIDVSDEDGYHFSADSIEITEGRLVLKRDGRLVCAFNQWRYVFEIDEDMLRDDLPGETTKPDEVPVLTQ